MGEIRRLASRARALARWRHACRMERSPDLWGQRPLAQQSLSHAAQSICPRDERGRGLGIDLFREVQVYPKKVPTLNPNPPLPSSFCQGLRGQKYQPRLPNRIQLESSWLISGIYCALFTAKERVVVFDPAFGARLLPPG